MILSKPMAVILLRLFALVASEIPDISLNRPDLGSTNSLRAERCNAFYTRIQPLIGLNQRPLDKTEI